MTLRPGMRLGPYEILSPLGAGGMGEVYRASDTRLGRQVAVKVLPSHLSQRPQVKVRFEREARAISQLTHPHICTLHDVGSEDGIDFLVMELLDGKTLAERIQAGSLPLELVLRVGMQIADALDRAHRAGVVHRDLKPSNIMLTKTGVKLLDFGLARLAIPAEPLADLSSAPTQTAPAGPLLTEEGMVLGTLPYMAPEQVEGKPADARTDIHALGAILYEMVTGRQPFAGGSAASLMVAILSSSPPPLLELVPSTPAPLDRLIATCLARGPSDRWQSAHDLRLELAGLLDDLAKPAVAATARRKAGRAPLLLAAAMVAAALVAGALLSRHDGLAAAPVAFTVPPPPGEVFRSRFDSVTFALSPDGTRLAFIAEGPPSSRAQAAPGHSSARVWLRRLNALQPQALKGTEGASSLFWSPDGRAIAFLADGRLKRVDLAGELPIPICDVPGGRMNGTWGSGGTILFATPYVGVVYQVPAEGGGRPRPVITPDPAHGEVRAVWPWFLPDGKSFLYVAARSDGTGELMMASLDGAHRSIAPMMSRVEYADPGFLVFARDGALMAQRFAAREGRLTGPLLPLAPTVYSFYTSKWAGFSASRAGTLAFAPTGNLSHLAWFDRAGRELARLGSTGAGNTLNLALSPDGHRALFDRTRQDLGTLDLWMIDLERGVESQLTSDPTTEFAPVWLPDGKGIVYSVARQYPPRLMLRRFADGRELPLRPGGPFQEAFRVTPDGRRVLFSQTDAGGVFGLWMLPLGGDRTPSPVPVSTTDIEDATLSPDGRYVAFIAKGAGGRAAYVASLDSPSERVRLAEAEAIRVVWNPSQPEILFTTSDRRLIAVPVTTAPTLQVGGARALFTLPAQGWTAFDVATDGRLLAAVQDASDTTQPLTLVTAALPR